MSDNSAELEESGSNGSIATSSYSGSVENIETLTGDIENVNGVTVVGDVVLWATKYKDREEYHWKKDGMIRFINFYLEAI